MQDGVEVVCEEMNDFEVVYDEEFDPERERQLEERMAQETGGLSSYWASIQNTIIMTIQITSQRMQESIGMIFTDTMETASLKIVIILI